MKKRLLSIIAMVTMTLGMSAATGDDLTSKYLKNADFSADSPMQQGICTYAKDMVSNLVEFYGMQAVTNWIASNPTDNVSRTNEDATLDARAAGVYAIGVPYLDEDTEIFLGGKNYHVGDAEGMAQGNALGLVAVWGGNLQYTQEVTFPAGAYTVEFLVYNHDFEANDEAVAENLFGFIAGDKKFLADNKTWTADTWETMTINFVLEEETTGVISLGYKAAGAGSAKMPHLFVSHVKILEGDAQTADIEAANKLKPELVELLNKAEQLSVDASAEQDVYDNENATLAQVQAAIESLKTKIANAMTDFTDYFINNAHFDMGTPLDNGVCTYDYDMPKNSTTYFGMQPIDLWVASSPSDNIQRMENDKSTPANPLNSRASGLFAVGSGDEVWLGSAQDKVPATKANGSTEGNVFGFISVWSGTAYYTQNVTLPAGSYTITIPTYNERGTKAIAKNLCGFISDEGDEYLAQTTTFPVGEWKNETIEFKLEEETTGKISIGYQAANLGSGDMPHLFIDEFTLMFNGKTDIAPSLIALNGAIRSAENLMDNIEYYEKALENDLNEALEEGNKLKDAGSADDAANTAAATKVSNAAAALRASATLYDKFQEFLDGAFTDAIDKYYDGDLSSFSDELSAELQDHQDAHDEGTYTTDQINEIMNGLNDRIVAAVKAALETSAADGQAHNLDISCLFTNLDFANNNVNGWQNETGSSKFLSRDHTAEVWNENFNVYQTLENMPVGVYELQTPAFYRTDANDANYAQWADGNVTGKSYIYVGGNVSLIHNVAEFASDQDDNHTADTGVGTFVPNSNANANYIFTNQTEESMNTVQGALVKEGTLTIGVKGIGLAANCWTVWGASKVIYKGNDNMAAAVLAEVKNKAEMAQEANEDAELQVNQAHVSLSEAIDEAADCDESSNVEDMVKVIEDLDNAMAYANESKTLFAQIGLLYQLYAQYLLPEVVSGDDVFPNLVAEIDVKYTSEGFESNEEIEGYMEQIPTAFTAYCQFDGLNATIDEPFNMSDAIINRGFEGIPDLMGNGGYWNKAHEGGNDFGYEYGIYESYNTNTFDINQTIKGLAAGLYKVRVQGFYRAGTNQGNADAVAGDSANFVNFYANDVIVKLNNQLENGTNGEAIGVGDEPAIIVGENEEYYVPNNREALAEIFSYEEPAYYWNELFVAVGEDGELTIGLKKDAHVANDWCPFDNFELYYLGKDIPAAVEGVAANTSAAAKAIYDLSGRKVSKAQKGIYIIDGKKVVK